MTTLTCIAVDDEPLALGILENYCQKVPLLQRVGSFRSGVDAIAFLAQQTVDLAFLDINMPELSGLQLAKHLQGRTQVVFTTAYPEYALTGYELDVIDYLVKPIAFDRFVQAVTKANRRVAGQPATTATALPPEGMGPSPVVPSTIETLPPQVLRIKSGTQFHHIPAHQLLYAEGAGNYVTFYLPDRKVLSLMTMAAAEELLPRGQFLRIHKSYIVNLQHIRMVDTNDVYIGATALPIGKSYRQLVKGPLGLT